MKLVIILVIQTMSHIEFEKLIGKEISLVKHSLVNEFDNSLYGNNFYYTHNHEMKFYNGIPYNVLKNKYR